MLKGLFGRNSGEAQARALIEAGNKAEGEGRLAEARGLYEKALAAAPRLAAAHLNLGAVLEAGGDPAAAERAYRALLAFEPENPFANYNLANLEAARGDAAAAEQLLRKALREKPAFPEAHVALSNLLDQAGRGEDALACLRTAIEQRPDYAGAWFNMGALLRRLDRLDEAEDALRRAIGLDPAYLPARLALVGLLRGAGRTDDALRCFDEAPGAARDWAPLESAWLLTALHAEVADEELFARHRRFAERLEAAHALARHAHSRGDDAERRLRVGYVSADFRVAPLAAFMMPVLAHHDRARFEVHCYMTGRTRDPIGEELRRLADRWHEAAAMDDAALAAAIAAERIDILVDLDGHAGEMRLGTFARQPAPVQATWLGYLHSTGMRAIAYRLTDAQCDPPGLTERLHTEQLVRLPDSQWCYRPMLSVPHAKAPPCERNGFITFGSFNHPAKLVGPARRAFHEVLARVPGSRLLVAGVGSQRTAEQLRREIIGGSIDAARVQVLPRMDLDRYFPLFDDVDIALDSLPYSGGTSTCDALWMGVPVVTAPGTRSASRSCASLLASAGLGDWIAASPAGYAELAASKAADRRALAGLRATLRQRLRASPVMDEARFTRALEAALRGMWREWCHNRA